MRTAQTERKTRTVFSATALLVCTLILLIPFAGKTEAATEKSLARGVEVKPLQVQIPDNPFAGIGERFSQMATQEQSSKNWQMALAYWETASAFFPDNAQAKTEIASIKAFLESNANKHFAQAREYLQKDNTRGKAFISFLRGLGYDPTNEEALRQVKYELNAKHFVEYTAVEGDTPQHIAKAEYNDPELGFLVNYYNDLPEEKGIVPGQKLQLPVMVGVIYRPPVAVASVKTARPASPKKEQVQLPQELEEEQEEDEAQYHVQQNALKLAEAQKFLDKGDFLKAAVVAEEALENDAVNSDTRALINAAYYGEGLRLENEGKGVAAIQQFGRVAPNYKDVSERIKTLQGRLQGQQAEIHYVAGVTHYLNEDLDKAIMEWEKALKIDPNHAQASRDLNNAKTLKTRLSNL